jgi:hypothetical protein
MVQSKGKELGIVINSNYGATMSQYRRRHCMNVAVSNSLDATERRRFYLRDISQHFAYFEFVSTQITKTSNGQSTAEILIANVNSAEK